MRKIVNLCVLMAFAALLGGCAVLHPAGQTPYMYQREQHKSYS